jgi:hypothetical protein
MHDVCRFQQFSGDADELRAWLHEKRRTATDENYRDLANLERKLQKHEAFERELRSNHGRMRELNKVRFCLNCIYLTEAGFNNTAVWFISEMV